MALEIDGKLVKLLPVQTGEGQRGPWTKQDFILETFGEYPKKICFSAWGERSKEIQAFPAGSLLKISFTAESREYNERWYTDLRPYRIEQMGVTNAPAAGYTQQQQPVSNATAMPPVVEPVEGDDEESDDLPF